MKYPFKKTIKKLPVIIFLLFFLGHNLIVSGQEEELRYEINFAANQIEIATQESHTPLAFSFKTRIYPTCKVKAEFSLPGTIDASGAKIEQENAGGLNPTFDKNEVREDTERPGYKIYTIRFNPDQTQLSGNFSISGFRSTLSYKRCEPQLEILAREKIYVKLVPEDCNEEETKINKEENECILLFRPLPSVKASAGHNFRLISSSSNSDCDLHPLRAGYSLTFTKGDFNAKIASVKLKYDPELECIGITQSNSISDFYNNLRNIEDKVTIDKEAGTITLPAELFSTGSTYFILYFNPKDRSVADVGIKSFSSSVSYWEKKDCGDSPYTPEELIENNFQPRNLDFSNCYKPENENVPDIQFSVYSLQMESCNNTSATSTLSTQVDHSYKGIAPLWRREEPLYYELDLTQAATDILIQRINLISNNYSLIEMGDIYYRYKVRGEANWSGNFIKLTATAISFGNQVPEIIQFKITRDLKENFSQAFQFTFSSPTGKDGDYNIYQRLFQEQDRLLKEREGKLTVVHTSSDTYSNTRLYTYWQDKDTKRIVTNKALEREIVYPVILKVGSMTIPDNFEILLHEYLEFYRAEGIKWYYGSADQFYNYHADDFKELREYYFETDKNQFNFKNFRNLNLPDNDCENFNKSLYLLFQVKLRANVPSTHGTTPYLPQKFKSSNTTGLNQIYSTAYFSVMGSMNFNSDMYVGCEEEQYTCKISLAGGDEYVYKCVIDNGGGENLKNIHVVGSFPHTGDVKVFSRASRGSQFTLPLSTIREIQISRLTEDGQELSLSSGDINSLTNGWQLHFSEESYPCLSEMGITGQAGCRDGGWHTGLRSNSILFRIQSPDNESVITPYGNLIIKIKGTFPPGIPEGYKGHASFISDITAVYNNERTMPMESLRMATVTVGAKSSCVMEERCATCPNGFSPLHGEKYVLSAWVKDGESANPFSYDDCLIKLTFEEPLEASCEEPEEIKCRPEGAVIEGWQRIQKEFTVPEGTVNIKIELLNESNSDEVYFDDIRVFPFNGNMKSYVYDPVSLRLVAELDNENYATFYEYDEEGTLIRIKKETQRGIMTLQETRQAKPKILPQN